MTHQEPSPAASEIQAMFRRTSPEHHLVLSRYTRDEVYDGGRWMAPGGLLLASQMVDHLAPKPGASILYLGCGRGQSSVFLAKGYGASVVSMDLWISAEERRQCAAAAGVLHLVTPLDGDIRRGVPMAHRSFDAIFCLQAFHCFGTTPAFPRYLASLLKPGGTICIAQGCFSEEFGEVLPPFTETDGWNVEYETYHWPAWWRAHFTSSGVFDVSVCREVAGGDVLWEDDVLYRGDRAGWSEDYLARSRWLICHILHGRSHRPSLTHMLLAATRRDREAVSSSTDAPLHTS
jgi:SAM-dependent methyltransferase